MPWSGHEGGSDAAAQALAARAKAGDQAALDQLATAAGLKGADTGAWRPDHRNAAIDAWNSLGLGAQVPAMDNPHHGLGGVLGSALKIASPFAALIPGVGIPLAGALGAGGSALGGALSGDKFNLGKTLLAGGAGAAGSALLHGQGYKGIPGLLGMGGGGGQGGIPGAPNISGMGDATYQPGLDPGMSGGGGGLLSKIFGNGKGGLDLGNLLGTGAAIAGGIGAANTQDEANRQRQAAITGATQEWNQRAPLRGMAQQQLMGLSALQRPDLSALFADPGNPFARKVAPLGAR